MKIKVEEDITSKYFPQKVDVTINGVTERRRNFINDLELRRRQYNRENGYSGFDEYPDDNTNDIINELAEVMGL